MNYQILDQMKEYEPEFDQMLFHLPLSGSTFKKVYYDDLLHKEHEHPLYGPGLSYKQYQKVFPEYFGLADGGRAGYMGGGITGILKPNAIAPTGGPMSQGLRSLYNNVKKS